MLFLEDFAVPSFSFRKMVSEAFCHINISRTKNHEITDGTLIVPIPFFEYLESPKVV